MKALNFLLTSLFLIFLLSTVSAINVEGTFLPCNSGNLCENAEITAGQSIQFEAGFYSKANI